MKSIALTNNRRNIPVPVWLIGLAAVIISPLTANPFLTSLALLMVPLLFLMLWRPGEAPILLFACGYQWLQATAKIFHADILGVEVSQLFFNDSVIEQTIFYCLVGILVLALGIRLGAGKISGIGENERSPDGLQISMKGAWKIYLYSAVFGLIIGRIAWLVPGLTQILIKIADLRFFFLFVLASVVLQQHKGVGLLGLAIAVETLVGFLGYFSGFKMVFFVLIIAYLGAKPNLSARDYVFLSIVASLLLTLSLFWTSIKMDYRSFLSQGEQAQVVKVDVQDRLSWISSAAVSSDLNAMQKAVTDLANRAAYVDFFGLVMGRVPSRMPYENGELWWSALHHVFTPRLFFPSKPRLASDSELTEKYTGLRLPGYREGTSISIGYMGESYIDFGFPGMLMPIFLVGLLWGLIYRYLIGMRPYTIFNQAAAMYVLLGAVLLEITNVKLLGGVLTSFIAVALLMLFVMSRILPYLVQAKRGRA